MTTCDICKKETPNQPTHSHPVYDEDLGRMEETQYALCDDCEAEIQLYDADAKDMAQIKREWREYRNEGLGKGA